MLPVVLVCLLKKLAQYTYTQNEDEIAQREDLGVSGLKKPRHEENNVHMEDHSMCTCKSAAYRY